MRRACTWSYMVRRRSAGRPVCHRNRLRSPIAPSFLKEEPEGVDKIDESEGRHQQADIPDGFLAAQGRDGGQSDADLEHRHRVGEAMMMLHVFFRQLAMLLHFLFVFRRGCAYFLLFLFVAVGFW